MIRLQTIKRSSDVAEKTRNASSLGIKKVTRSWSIIF